MTYGLKMTTIQPHVMENSMNFYRKTIFLIWVLAMISSVYEVSAAEPGGLCILGQTPTTSVSSADALKSALSTARPGNTIVVKGGNYSGDFTLSKSGTAAEPITVRADGNVTFKNSVFTLKGSYGVLTGMTFNNGMVTVIGDYNRVTANVFHNGQEGGNNSKLHSAVHTEGGASYNRIDHNEVVNWQRRAIRNTQLNSRTTGNRFDHNYIHNMKGAWGNSGEAFQVGTGPNDPHYAPKTIIEYNLLDGHNLEGEVLSLKANGNMIRGNTFMNASKGNVQSRNAKDNTFMNNTLINIKSMTIYGDNNKVISNKFVNSNLEIKSGDAIFPDLLLKNSDGNHKYAAAHPAARDTIVAGNQFSGGRIRLGKKGTGTVTYSRTFPAENTVLAENQGAAVVTEGGGKVKGTKTLSTYSGTLGKPVQIKSSQVGPNAPDPLCENEQPITPVLLPPTNLRGIVAKPSGSGTASAQRP
jgi:Chondroitinase B